MTAVEGTCQGQLTVYDAVKVPARTLSPLSARTVPSQERQQLARFQELQLYLEVVDDPILKDQSRQRVKTLWVSYGV